jgi:hypothetical protein
VPPTRTADERDLVLPTGRPLRGVLTGLSVALLAVLAVFAATAAAAHRRPAGAPAPTAAPVPVDALAPVRGGTLGTDWQNWSWAASVAPRRTAPDGTPAVEVTFRDGYAGLSLRQSTPTRPAAGATLRARVWVDGTGTWLGLTVQSGDRSPGRHGPDGRVAGGRWVTLSVPVRSLGPAAAVQRISLEHRSAELRGAHQPVRVWVAELVLG